MPLSVTCGACKKQFSVPDHYAGKTGKCTQCGAPILAPANSPPAPKIASDDQLKAAAPAAPGASDKVGVGSTLAGYKIQKRLGGDRSSVFLAQGPSGAVAIKVLPREVTEQSPTAAKRFLREARSLFGHTHANVAACLDAGEELGTLFLVMELFSGRTVRELMAERGGKVPTAEALKIALQVARGLEHLNEQKLVHRNVMPEHILVDADGVAKIVGLGLVKSEDEQAVTMRGVAVGTPQYMAPELAAGSPDLDTRCDLWALGITAYEMLAGEVPWFHKQPLRLLQMVQNEAPPPLRDKNPTVSPTAVLVIEKLLQKNRDQRYQTPGELVLDLQAIEEGTLVQGKPPSFVSGGATNGVASSGVSKSAAKSPGKTGKIAAAPPAASGTSDALVKKLLVAVVFLIVLVLMLLVAVVVLVLKK